MTVHTDVVTNNLLQDHKKQVMLEEAAASSDELHDKFAPPPQATTPAAPQLPVNERPALADRKRDPKEMAMGSTGRLINEAAANVIRDQWNKDHPNQQI